MAIKASIMVFILVVAGSGRLFSQCTDTADFSGWFETNGSGNWQVISPVEVSQDIEIFPTKPSFFVSDQPMINVRFSFDVESLNPMDNDFIGFVAGYRNPFSSGSDNYSFLLFDWKAKAETGFNHFAEEGFHLAAFNREISPDDIHRYFWGRNFGNTVSGYEILGKSYGDNKGWRVGEKYHVEVFYLETSIKILIDDQVIFDVKRCNQAGRIGFYTYSQHSVVFSNFQSRTTAAIFASPEVVCSGDTVFASITDPSCPAYDPAMESWQINWGDGSISYNNANDFHVYNEAGSYTLELIARFPGTCYDTAGISIAVQSRPDFNLGPDTTIIAGTSVTLSAGDFNPGWTYQWSTGSGLPQITLAELDRDTTVGLLVSSNLCQNYDDILIKVIQDTAVQQHDLIWMPNVFSPDGDGLNDIFRPVVTIDPTVNYELYVYDRWGTEIFYSSETGNGWDGSYMGRQCHGDVYVYLVRYWLNDQKQSAPMNILKGPFLLMK
jgi:gliding motility-associated-like protein